MIKIRSTCAPLFLLALVCGCHAPAPETPGEDMAAPTVDLRRPRIDLAAAAPDLLNPGPGSTRWAKDLHERPQSSLDGPVTVAVDSFGTSVHITGPREWQARIGKIPVTVA